MKNRQVKLMAGGNFGSSKIPEGYLLGNFAFAITICNSNDSTQLHIYEMQWGLQIYKMT